MKITAFYRPTLAGATNKITNETAEIIFYMETNIRKRLVTRPHKPLYILHILCIDINHLA